ncbi:hypothetical protein FN976_18040 [Caenimonas sedimenti]|uniref:ABC transporter substrate-binding protein n=1 Tax=Caenimonas sedimenti TaxID=2596921 RepID=A0A562ZN41_9BURK|nr:substrate-binding domain-containing protein [Caenimonas sedimenti]TWO69725.1 hypothetical protein FN976_18040 [Caenimonas sedimenti]
MHKAAKTLITLALLATFGGAAWLAFDRTAPSALPPALTGRPAQTVQLKGLIALDVEPYFKDPRVIEALAQKGFQVDVTRIGSRDMAARAVPGQAPDFFFPSGVVAANQIGDAARKSNIGTTAYSPFYTPMVIASWTPVAQVLAANGMAKETQPKVWSLDFGKLAQAMLERKRWNQLKSAGAYDVNKSILVSTTDVRRSNSAAQYLALTTHAINGGEVVSDRAAAQKAAQRAAELFKRQGYQENYVNGNFDDYVSIGMGKTPLAFIYENQMVSYALAKKGVAADMVLMYPQPTIFNKVVFVASSEKAKALGEALSTDPTLQRLAVDHGFRIGDTAHFVQVAKAAGLAVEERLSQVVDPPSFELMGEMIDVVAAEMGR